MTDSPDYSYPPQWVLDLYKPDALPPHVLVTEGEKEDEFLIQSIDLHAMNPFMVRLTASPEQYPLKGEVRVFTGTPEQLYAELKSGAAEAVLVDSVQKRLRECAPMFFGHPSELSGAGLVLHEYLGFRACEEAWEKDPENPIRAFDFINRHPMFWMVDDVRSRRRRRRAEATEATEVADEPYEMPNIITGRGFHRLDVMTLGDRGKDGQLRETVAIECGPGNYHDYNLDIYAPDFNAALVALAKRIHEHYNSHGGFTDPLKKEPNDNFFRDADLMPDDDDNASE